MRCKTMIYLCISLLPLNLYGANENRVLTNEELHKAFNFKIIENEDLSTTKSYVIFGNSAYSSKTSDLQPPQSLITLKTRVAPLICADIRDLSNNELFYRRGKDLDAYIEELKSSDSPSDSFINTLNNLNGEIKRIQSDTDYGEAVLIELLEPYSNSKQVSLYLKLLSRIGTRASAQLLHEAYANSEYLAKIRAKSILTRMDLLKGGAFSDEQWDAYNMRQTKVVQGEPTDPTDYEVSVYIGNHNLVERYQDKILNAIEMNNSIESLSFLKDIIDINDVFSSKADIIHNKIAESPI